MLQITRWLPAILLSSLALAGCGEPSTHPPPAVAEPTAGAVEAPRENVNLALMDDSIRPGDDFYGYANGAWLSSYQLPPDKTGFGNFHELFELSQERVQTLIEELAEAEPEQGSVEQKIGDYYASFLATEKLDALGFEPIRGELAAIAAIESLDEVIAAFGRADLEASVTPIALGIEIDRKNPERFIAGLYHAGLGLPERDYYLEDSERFEAIRRAYQDHISRMLELAGLIESADLAAAVLALETAVARSHWQRAERRNRDLTYNLTSLKDIEAGHPQFPWQTFFQAAGVVPEVVNVNHPNAIGPIIATIEETPIAVLKAYLAYHLIANNAAFLATEIDDANFQFYGQVLRGQPEQRERWRRAVSLVSSGRALGDAIGQVYVARYFSAQSKTMMEDLVANLQAALRERIAALDWMSEATKARAFEKLEAFLPKIGYPDEWRDFSTVQIDRDDLMSNVRQLRAYYAEDAIARLAQPTDRTEWFLPAQTVNATYSPQFNAITFPAGILEPPFFNPAADPAVNYGAIGAVIGHEMGHGFDDQGSKSDGQGRQINWWTDEDRQRFEQRAEVLSRQYSAYEAVPGTFVDGDFTLGENIGDLGGISIAYHAYRKSLNGAPAPVLDGLTGDQRFFIAFAQLWRSMIREEALVARLKADPHSPGEYRANGVVRNVDAWYQAFNVGEDSALYLAPDERVSIW